MWAILWTWTFKWKISSLVIKLVYIWALKSKSVSQSTFKSYLYKSNLQYSIDSWRYCIYWSHYPGRLAEYVPNSMTLERCRSLWKRCSLVRWVSDHDGLVLMSWIHWLWWWAWNHKAEYLHMRNQWLKSIKRNPVLYYLFLSMSTVGFDYQS